MRKDKKTGTAAASLLVVTAFRAVNAYMGQNTMTTLDYILFALGVLLVILYFASAIAERCRDQKDKKSNETF